MASTTDVPGGATSELELLADTPLENPEYDYFGFDAFASSLAYVIDSTRTVTPLTVAISAPWGGGKTSVARMAARHLDDLARDRLGERPNVVCWFNAWAHDDAPHLGAALAAAVARTADRNRPPWRRLVSALPGAMLTPRERWRRRVAIAVLTLVALGLALMIGPLRRWMSELPIMDETAAGLGTVGFVALAVIVLWPRLFAVAEQAARFIDDPGSEAARGSMTMVRDQLGKLVAQATRDGRFVLFVDDLERCRPERALEVCEVATQLLSQEGVVTVLVADMEAIARSASLRYPLLSGNNEADDELDAVEAGRRYLEKIVQIQLSLPSPDPDDMRRLLRGDAPLSGGGG
jgi:KAP family P-loop domain